MDRRKFVKVMATGAGAAAVGLPKTGRAQDEGPAAPAEFLAQSKKPITGAQTADYVVVGAGLSGLIAARELKRAGKKVLVVEARSRIGGRMFLKPTIAGGVLDIGGQWVGPTQTAMLALVDELKIEKFDSYEEGDSYLSWNGQREIFDGNVSKLLAGDYGVTPEEKAAEAAVWKELMTIASTVPADAPWNAPNAKALDGTTFQSWLEAKTNVDFAKWVPAMQARIGGSGGFEPGQASVLHMAWTQVVGPQAEMPETWLLHGGAGQIPALLAAELGDVIVLNAPVRGIAQESGAVTVTTANLVIQAKAAIVAIPPPLRAGIEFVPPLPPVHTGLIQRAAMGSMSKVHAVYPTAFWRPKHLSGSAAGNLKTCEFIADSGPPSGTPGILTSFIAADRNIELSGAPREVIRKAVLDDYTYYFGPEAANPAEFFHFNWNAQRWTTGAFTNYMPPGAWTTYGKALREPVGNVFWAGTETSPRWPGYFDGAIRAGQAAAAAALGKTA